MDEIILRIEPIANGYLITGSKSVDDYKVAQLPQTYVPDLEQVIAGLPQLFAAANALTAADGREDF